jgi:nucleotide-binding universal stress UspA family protein
MKVLIPVDGSTPSLAAVYRVACEARSEPAMALTLINVQRPLTSHAGQFLARHDLAWFRHSRAQPALAAARRLLDGQGLKYEVMEVSGDPAQKIVQAANEGGFDRIVLATTHKNALARLLTGSITQRIIDRAKVPVVVVPGGEASLFARYGLPVGLGLGLALYFFAAE